MNTILLAVSLFGAQPAVSTVDLETLFDVQQQEIRHEIDNGMRENLKQQGVRFFAANGDLERQLAASEVRAELAGR